MSYKRSRSNYESEPPSAPFAVFGTPLPNDSESRDDGSFVPIWKQEVRDERGRKRLHGAFTGGWSAGYFNTVGSKEGWTPSTFVSSRNNRQDAKSQASSTRQRAEDFMDEEDLADAAEAQKVHTSQAFAGLGSTTQNKAYTDRAAAGLMGLFRSSECSLGYQLLRKMGWKDGQGIGPKVRRAARLDLTSKDASSHATQVHLFAPDDAQMVTFQRKSDYKGLGYVGGQGLHNGSHSGVNDREVVEQDEDDEEDFGPKIGSSSLKSTTGSSQKAARGSIGVGVLNDNGSDEEDPYEMGPKIRYNKTLGGGKKKKKKSNSAVSNPGLKHAPVFLSKMARGPNIRKCHDGTLPLDGFVLAQVTEDFAGLLSEFAPPTVPDGWVSARDPDKVADGKPYISTAEAARASQLDAKARATILGEKALPGKSVFDFLSTSARDKMAAASGRADLPQAKGEVPEGYAVSQEDQAKTLWNRVPKLDQTTARAALSRSSGGPYADDEGKKGRYRIYLEIMASEEQASPYDLQTLNGPDFMREMNEFYNCARIFKPMTGFMASRFTTGKKTSLANSSSSQYSEAGAELLTKPDAQRPSDPAEEAAKMGMFGHMTRRVDDFFPTRLLCKRFNVKPPAHSQPDTQIPTTEAVIPEPIGLLPTAGQPSIPEAPEAEQSPDKEKVGSDRTLGPNKANNRQSNLAGTAVSDMKPAHEDMLKAIFGDSDSE